MMVLLMIVLISFISCGQVSKWEYKTVQIEGIQGTDFFPRHNFEKNIDSTLNTNGSIGWELINSYTQIETVHPNFGSSIYVTGLQPNVRTEKIVFIFKRKK